MERDLFLYTNSDFLIGVRWRAESGTTYALAAGAMQIRLTAEDVGIVLEAEVTIDGSTNIATATIPADDIATALGDSSEMRGVYDFVVTRSDDDLTFRVLQGKAVLLHGVTR